MQENNLKGLWIPYEILSNENLNDKEKYIYSLILFFSKKDGYCTITNKYIGIIVNLSDTRVSKLISSLANKKYVHVTTNFHDTTRQLINRKIIPLVKYDSPTTYSRRYLGMQTFDRNFYNVYAIYGEKTDKYITSIYYDIKKERDIQHTIVFTNDIERILYHKHKFNFDSSHLYLVPYNNFSKEIIVHYEKIKTCMFMHLSKRHEVEYTDFRYMDFLVDNEKYLKIMLFLDLNQIYSLSYFFNENSGFKNNTYLICFEENVKYLQELLPGCNTLAITKTEVEEYIKKDIGFYRCEN